MWTTEHTVETTATPEAVWREWSDVASWPVWDDELETVTLDGAFEVGARGRLKPRGGPTTRFTLTRVEPGRGFADETRLLPGAWMRFEHELADGRLTHRVAIDGPLGGLVSRLLGKKLEAGLPRAVAAVAARAEAAA